MNKERLMDRVNVYASVCITNCVGLQESVCE